MSTLSCEIVPSAKNVVYNLRQNDKQVQQIKIPLHPLTPEMKEKNKKAIKAFLQGKNQEVEVLIPHPQGNVTFSLALTDGKYCLNVNYGPMGYPARYLDIASHKEAMGIILRDLLYRISS